MLWKWLSRLRHEVQGAPGGCLQLTSASELEHRAESRHDQTYSTDVQLGT